MAKVNRNMRAVAAVAGAMTIAALAGSASAQTVGEDFLEFGAQVDLRYDSNVVNGNSERAEARGYDEQIGRAHV